MKTMKILLLAVLMLLPTLAAASATVRTDFKLGNEVFLDEYRTLIEGKRIGLITSFSGVNSQGESLINIISKDPKLNLVALFGPEHGIDGSAPAGAKVNSYVHPVLNIPVHSLYGEFRKPTPAMLQGIDVLLFDIQDIGARTYTYISTMNYTMIAARENNIPYIVLDRPNPLGGLIVEGPVLEDYYKSFVGVDNLPMAHGMTIGELALYFNRLIDADLTVIPMEGYTREMIFQDTGLDWVQTSPNIPCIVSAFGYMATGLAEGTGIFQADQFKWVGGRGLNSETFAALLNSAGLPGVTFVPETRGTSGGARLNITNYHTFNPARSGLYALFYARSLWKFNVPKSGSTPASVVMFDKVMGTNRVGQWLEANYTPQLMQAAYQAELNAFKKIREQYLIYGVWGTPKNPALILNGVNIYTDVLPVITNARTMVPIRVIAESLGAEVDWIEKENAVIIQQQGTTIRLTLNSRTAQVNDLSKQIPDVAPYATGGRTLVPFRFVSEYLGATVDWCDKTFSVIILK
jgi:uncharacterized protein YbbC (DUF1343 family)